MRVATLVAILVLLASSASATDGGKGVGVENTNTVDANMSTQIELNTRSEGTDMPPELPYIPLGPAPFGVTGAPNLLVYDREHFLNDQVVAVSPVGTQMVHLGKGFYAIPTRLGISYVRSMGEAFTMKARTEGILIPGQKPEVAYRKFVEKAVKLYPGQDLHLLVMDSPTVYLKNKTVGGSAGLSKPDSTNWSAGFGFMKNITEEKRASLFTVHVFKRLIEAPWTVSVIIPEPVVEKPKPEPKKEVKKAPVAKPLCDEKAPATESSCEPKAPVAKPVCEDPCKEKSSPQQDEEQRVEDLLKRIGVW
jgi:hypothetical protein